MKNIAYFNLMMECQCPHCDHVNDLENGDEGAWVDRFKAWINNVPGAEDFDVDHPCDECGETFKIEGARR